MYYAIEIDSSLFLLGLFPRCFSPFVWLLFDMDLYSLFIVREPPHIVYLDPDSNSKTYKLLILILLGVILELRHDS
jgi:hypothetical protein